VGEEIPLLEAAVVAELGNPSRDLAPAKLLQDLCR